MVDIDNSDWDAKLDELRRWFVENPKLPQEIDSLLLKRFLKCMYGDFEATKKLIELNYTLRNKHPHIFLSRDPQDESVKKVREACELVVLPGLTPERHKLLCFRIVDRDASKMNSVEECKIFFMIADCRYTMADVVEQRDVLQQNVHDKIENVAEDGDKDVVKNGKQDGGKDCDKDGLNDEIKDAVKDGVKDSLIDGVKVAAKDGFEAVVEDGLQDDEKDGAKNDDIDGYAQDNMADGEVHIVDISNYTMGHIARISFKTLRIYMKYLQEAYPVRMRAMHIINCPSYLDKMIAVVKPFIADEVYKMIHFHTSGLESLYDHVPRHMLPEEYGGNAGKMSDLKDQWTRILDEKRSYLMDPKQWKVEQTESRSGWWWF